MDIIIHNPHITKYSNRKLYDKANGHYVAIGLKFDDDEIIIFSDREYVFMSKDEVVDILQNIAEDALETKDSHELGELINQYAKEL